MRYLVTIPEYLLCLIVHLLHFREEWLAKKVHLCMLLSHIVFINIGDSKTTGVE